MSESPIGVQVDDRIRLLSAVLALTTWPDQEQALRPHGVHAHARATRTALAEAEHHLAVQTMQEMLESTLTMEAIFSYAAYIEWPSLKVDDPPEHIPDQWPGQLRDFLWTYKVLDLWQRDEGAWESAQTAARSALTQAEPRAMLARLFGGLNAQLYFQPNLSYPTAETICFRDENRLICISPPPVAWGTNPPWPYDDNPADTAREAFSAYVRLLLREHLDEHPAETEAARRTRLPVPNTFLARYPDWFDQLAVLFVSGATALYMRQTFGKAEADAYTMMIQKASGFHAMPTVVDLLEQYLDAHAEGRAHDFAEYLPTFTNSFQEAEKMKKA